MMNQQRTLAITFLVGWFLLLSPLPRSSAETIRLLGGEEEALQTRLDLISQASCTIEMSYYQIRDDDSAGQVLHGLVQAAARGVQVRIIVDGHPQSNNLPKGLIDYLVQHGVQLRERPVDVRYKVELGRPRIHDKLFIVDRTQLVMGGRNLEESYFGIGCKQYVDHDVLFVGCKANEAANYFDQRWSECITATPRLTGPDPKKALKRQVHLKWNTQDRCTTFAEIDAWLAECAAKPLAAKDICGNGGSFPEVESNCLEFLHDCVGGSKRSPAGITNKLHQLLRSAKRSIEISTPYCVVTHELRAILTEAARRGVKISILTNSLDSTDQVLAHAGFANERRWMIRNGIQLYEYKGGRTMHSKLIIVDGAHVAIGSHNLDNLSERTNSEVAMLVHNAEFTSHIRKAYYQMRASCATIERGDLIRHEVRESNTSEKKLKEFQRARLVTPIIQRYL